MYLDQKLPISIFSFEKGGRSGECQVDVVTVKYGVKKDLENETEGSV